MKKLLFSSLIVLSITSCQKQISNDKVTEKVVSVSQKNQSKKINICHNGQTISINSNAWPGHQAHGDSRGECLTNLSVTICDQTWMVKNLDVTTYRNGDPIPEVSDPTEWSNLTTGAWCYYENNIANGVQYGKLYNWEAVNDPRGLAPAGWHIPSDDEWKTLASCLGGAFIAGGPMKTTGTIEDGTGLWASPNTGATNSSGFSGLPGGIRAGNQFYWIGQIGQWWSSTEEAGNIIVDWNLGWLYDIFSRNTNLKQQNGFSVRCVKD